MIKRYFLEYVLNSDVVPCLTSDGAEDEGEWVSYEDHAALIQNYEQTIDEQVRRIALLKRIINREILGE